MSTRKMGMFTQDPIYPSLREDYEFNLERDFLALTGTARFEMRDELIDGTPMFAVLNWADPATDLSCDGMSKRVLAGNVSAEALENQPEFHQVNLLAVSDYVLEFVEREIGQAITWHTKKPLILRPHAFEERNAYFDPNEGSMNFGYFWSPFHRKTVWTCLSHDTIAHELGHAILSALRPLFDYSLEPEVMAFHESFADLISLFACLGHKNVAQQFLPDEDSLDKPNIVSDFAEEFGAGLYGAGYPYLRSALNPAYYDPAETEPHNASEVLTGAMYEIIRKLIKDEQASTEPFSQKVTHAVERVRGMFLRTLSYLPPTGVTLPQFAVIFLKADELAYPDEKDARFRTLAKETFERRKLLDASIDCRAPNFNEKSVWAAAEQGTEALMRIIDGERTKLAIPAEAMIVRVWMRRTRRHADHDKDSTGNSSLREIQEHYLYYTYESIVAGEVFTFSGTLVFSENWKALCWVSDPCRLKDDKPDDPGKRYAARVQAQRNGERLSRLLDMADDLTEFIEADQEESIVVDNGSGYCEYGVPLVHRNGRPIDHDGSRIIRRAGKRPIDHATQRVVRRAGPRPIDRGRQGRVFRAKHCDIDHYIPGRTDQAVECVLRRAGKCPFYSPGR